MTTAETGQQTLSAPLRWHLQVFQQQIMLLDGQGLLVLWRFGIHRFGCFNLGNRLADRSEEGAKNSPVLLACTVIGGQWLVASHAFQGFDTG